MRRNSVLLIITAAVLVTAGLAIRARRPAEPPAPAAPPAPPLGRVTVAVYEEGAPRADRWVVFHDREGNVLARAKSGRDGKASGEVPAGGMITVAQAESPRHLVTFVDVQPGDAIVIGEKDEEETVAKSVGAARVRLASAHPGAARHVVDLGVGPTDVAPGAPVTLTLLDRFIHDGKRFAVLGEALDGAGEPLAFAFTWGAWDDAKTKTHGTADVTLGPWSKDYRTFDVALTDPPEGATSARGTLSIFAKDEDRFDRNPRQTALPGTLSFPVPPPLGSEASIRIEIPYGAAPDRFVLLQREESLATKTVIDLREVFVPRISAAKAEPTDARARPRLSWTVLGDATRARAMDALLVRASWPPTRENVWTVVLPPGTTAPIRLPELPRELAAFAPDGSPIGVAAALVEASFYDGYADVRRKGIMLLHEPPEDEKGRTLLRFSVTGDLEL